MIIKVISRMEDPGGLTRYLAGKGTDNEHTDQHTVAGTVHYQGDLSVDKDLVAQIAADLRTYSQMWPGTKIPEGKIWHTTISLPPQDGVLSDDRWKEIAEDYMTRMGLTDPRKAPIRWTAVRHGLSTERNDHIHIVANLVREDGTKASVFSGDMIMGGVRNLIETYTSGGSLFANITPNTHMMSYQTSEAKLASVYITEKVDRKTGWQYVCLEEEWTRGYQQEIQDFMECVATGRQPLSDLALAFETIKVAYAGYWAAEDGRRVTL